MLCIVVVILLEGFQNTLESYYNPYKQCRYLQDLYQIYHDQLFQFGVLNAQEVH